MSLPKLLIVNNGQFGYQSGYYFYAKYLRFDYDITILCHDRGLEKVNLPCVRVKYVEFGGGKLKRHLRWIKAVAHEVSKGDYDLSFMVYFKLCFLIGLLYSKKRIILDIRSGSLKRNPIANYIQNRQINFEARFFKKITILSRGLIRHLHLNQKKCHWLPLGAEKINHKVSNYRDLKLLYVGTFNFRNIHETIDGFAKFYKRFGEYINCSYNIFGFGTPREENLIKERIRELELESIVTFHGRKKPKELEPYFRECNVGVCYVPITRYYEYQPPTKTFEYILSGMICIGTSTYENIQLINKNNGLLCRDTSQSFFESLKAFYFKRHLFKYQRVVGSLEKYRWMNIVNNNLKPFLEKTSQC